MKKLLLSILVLLPITIKAQAPVSPVQMTTSSAYIEPSTHNRWFYNGVTYGWWQVVDSIQLQRNLLKYQLLSQKNQANGYVGLDANSHVLPTYLGYNSGSSNDVLHGDGIFGGINLATQTYGVLPFSLGGTGYGGGLSAGVSLRVNSTGDAWESFTAATAGSGVTSFNGRAGAVVPQSADYSSFYPLQSLTVAGFPLSSNVTLASHTVGNGLIGSGYNGSAAQAWRIDTTNIINNTRLTNYTYTKAQADSRFAPVSGSSVYELLNNKVTVPDNSTIHYPTTSLLASKVYNNVTVGVNGVLRQVNDATTWDMSPLGNSWTWHDVAAFGNNTPQYYISTDYGTGWTSATLPAKLFQQKQNTASGVTLTNTAGLVNGIRLVYNNANFATGYISWLVLHPLYTGYFNKLNVLVEQSADGTTWVTTHTSSQTSSNVGSVGDFYKITNNSNGYFRITITIDPTNTAGAFTSLAALRLLSLRTGNQGYGHEFEFPFSWDENKYMSFTYPATFNPTIQQDLNTGPLYRMLALNSSGNQVPMLHNPSKLLSSNSNGDPTSILSDVPKTPIYYDGTGNIQLSQLDRSAVVIPDGSRSNLQNSLTYTHVTNGTYGYNLRQSGDDTNIYPDVINGKNVIHFVLNRNQSVFPERSELLNSSTVDNLPWNSTERVRWFGTSLYVPKDFLSDNLDIQPIVFQWHDATLLGKQPVQSMRIVNNHWIYYITGDTDPTATSSGTSPTYVSHQYDLGPVNLGRFTNFVVNLKWQTDGNSDGYVKVWKDGVLVVNYTGVTCDYEPATTLPYLKFGIYNYRWGTIPSGTTTLMNQINIYHGDTRYGYTAATMADVNPDGTFQSNNVPYNINIDADSARVRTSLILPAITSKLLKTNGSGLVSGATAGTDYENPLTFSTGLTRNTNTITNDAITGKAGGTTHTGGTASGENLTLTSTANATKGNILFGTSGYDEVNNKLGIRTTSPITAFSNTTSNFTDAIGTGINSAGLAWSVGSGGFVGGFYNSSTSSNANGLLVKVLGNTATNKAFGVNITGIDFFTVTGQGYVGYLTNLPTHTITMSSSTTGFAVYNTTDQTTNYERNVFKPISNVYTWESQNGGTGTARGWAFSINGAQKFTLDATGNGVFTGSLRGNSLISTTVTPTNVFQTPTGTRATDSVMVKIAATGKMGAVSASNYGSGTVTSVGTGYGLTGGTITTTGTLLADSTKTFNKVAGTTQVVSANASFGGTVDLRTGANFKGGFGAAFYNSANTFSTLLYNDGTSANYNIALPRGNGMLALTTDVPLSGTYTTTATAQTSFTVTIGSTQANTTYKVNVTPTSLLAAAAFYVANKTTTTFDVVYLSGITGAVAFDWSLFK